MAQATRHGRGLLVAVVLVVIGCLVLVGVDRVVAHLAEDRAEARLQQQLHLSAAPDVNIDGFPFLTQLARHRFRHVTVTADDLTLGADGSRVSLQHVDLDLHQVRTTPQLTLSGVGDLTGSLTLTWSGLSGLSGRTIGFDHADAGGGWIKVTDSVEVAGRDVDVSLVARPVLDAQAATITLTDPTLTVLGGIELPDRLTDALVSRYVDAISLPMPEGIAPTGLTVGREGVRLEITGREVHLGGR